MARERDWLGRACRALRDDAAAWLERYSTLGCRGAKPTPPAFAPSVACASSSTAGLFTQARSMAPSAPRRTPRIVLQHASLTGPLAERCARPLVPPHRTAALVEGIVESREPELPHMALPWLAGMVGMARIARTRRRVDAGMVVSCGHGVCCCRVNVCHRGTGPTLATGPTPRPDRQHQRSTAGSSAMCCHAPTARRMALSTGTLAVSNDSDRP